MLVTRRNQNWLPSVFNEMIDEAFALPKVGRTAPAVNVIEHKDGYTVEFAAPGMTRDDFKVTLDEDENLVVDLEKKTTVTDGDAAAEKNAGRYLRREFSYTKYHQTLLLPEDVDRDHIAATVEHGVLTVTLPKKSAQELKKEAKVIEIK